MKTKRISAFPDQVDLQGLPAARLRAVLLALASPEAAEIFDAQLADLHAEWLAARERSRLRAAWLGLGIRAQLLTCAAYYAVVSLGVPALRNAALLIVAAYITLGLFFGLANLIAPKPLGERIEPKIIDFERHIQVAPPKPNDFPKKPERLVTPVAPPTGDLVDWKGPNGPESGRHVPPGHGDGGYLVSERPEAPALGPTKFGKNFLCLPMVRSEPDYPTSAIRRRIEGSVVVEVSIDPSGSVSHAAVVQAEPAGVFDDAVLRAVRRWRYRVSGDGPSCEHAQVRLRFELPPGAR